MQKGQSAIDAECLTCLLDYDGFLTMLNTSLGNFKFNSNLNIFCFLSSSFWLLFRPAQKPENMIRIHLNNSSNLAFINKNWSICLHLILRNDQAQTESSDSVKGGHTERNRLQSQYFTSCVHFYSVIYNSDNLRPTFPQKTETKRGG